jgi:RNA polymerase sigma factor (sigma-70 family)
VKPVSADVVVKAQRGDKRALELVLASVEGLVARGAKRIRRAGLDVDDMLQEGRMGALRAVETFKPGKGANFATWAAYWVSAFQRRALKRAERLEADSLDEPIGDDETTLRIDTVPAAGLSPEERVADVELHEAVARVVTATGPKPFREVMRGQLRGEMLHETGSRLGLTREAVRLRRLRALEFARPALEKLVS